jgi:hypothetical protein
MSNLDTSFWLVVIYAIAGIFCGWFFVRKLPAKSGFSPMEIAAVSHVLSTVFAFFVFPTCISGIFGPTGWSIALLVSTLTGLPSVVIDLAVMSWLVDIPLSSKTFFTVWLWKGLTSLIFLGFLALLVFGYHVLGHGNL